VSARVCVARALATSRAAVHARASAGACNARKGLPSAGASGLQRMQGPTQRWRQWPATRARACPVLAPVACNARKGLPSAGASGLQRVQGLPSAGASGLQRMQGPGVHAKSMPCSSPRFRAVQALHG